jgi:outer membrane protein OmpA-like peptidoglycan-associated protein
MKRLALFFFFCFAEVCLVRAEEFRFQYAKGDKYRILSTVNERVYVNKTLSHTAEILNKIAVEVTEAENGRGKLSCVFQTSEEAHNGGKEVFSWGKTYESVFFRDALGRYTIGKEYFMPIVRDVPVFPERPLSLGDSWNAPGEEAHDFSSSLGIPEAVRFPINVSYRYAGTEERGGETYQVITISYDVFHRPRYDAPPAAVMYPVLIAGSSRQKLFWDSRRGRPQAYEEEFSFVFELSTGDSIEYAGNAHSDIIESTPMSKESMILDIRKALEELGVPDTEVHEDDLGITLTLENIQFPPDSALLVKAERDKLDRIGEILARYPERDILVSGHTALAGSRAGRQKLSEDRAASVGAYLIQTGVRTKDRMVYRGLGADVPVADNSTEEGRGKNRRVEITILEN